GPTRSRRDDGRGGIPTAAIDSGGNMARADSRADLVVAGPTPGLRRAGRISTRREAGRLAECVHRHQSLTSASASARRSTSVVVLNAPGLTRTAPSGNEPIARWMY